MCYRGEYMMKKYLTGKISSEEYNKFKEQEKVKILKGLEKICSNLQRSYYERNGKLSSI